MTKLLAKDAAVPSIRLWGNTRADRVRVLSIQIRELADSFLGQGVDERVNELMHWYEELRKLELHLANGGK